MTAARSANDVWLQDSNVFCACPRSCRTCSSVRSSKVATTWLSYGFTVWYAMVCFPSVHGGSWPPHWSGVGEQRHCGPALVLSLTSPSNGSQQMLPRQAGKSRYRDGSGSPWRWRCRAEIVAGQQFGRQVVPEISSCTKLSVAFAFFVKSAMGAHPYVGGSTAESCAAPRMPPMGEHVSTCSAV